MAQELSPDELETVLREHSARSPNDGRVKKDPHTGRIKGKFFHRGDPINEHMLEAIPEEERGIITKAEQAIAKNKVMYVTHLAHKAAAGVVPSRETRTKEYQKGERSQLAGHAILPFDVGMYYGKKGKASRATVYGLGASVAANNGQHINGALEGGKRVVPYRDLDDNKFGDDVAGYIRNLKNGWTGDGGAKIKGSEEHQVTQTSGYKPHRISQRESDFINAILYNDSVRWNTDNARIAKGIADAQGHGLVADKEANPIRHEIDTMPNPRRTYAPGQSEKPEKKWSHEMLETAVREFPTNWIHEVYDTPDEMEEGIRPPSGTQQIVRAFHQEGLPPQHLVAAHPRSTIEKELPAEKPRIRVPATPGKKTPPGPGEVSKEEPKAEVEKPAEPKPEKPRIRVQATPGKTGAVGRIITPPGPSEVKPAAPQPAPKPQVSPQAGQPVAVGTKRSTVPPPQTWPKTQYTTPLGQAVTQLRGMGLSTPEPEYLAAKVKVRQQIEKARSRYQKKMAPGPAEVKAA